VCDTHGFDIDDMSAMPATSALSITRAGAACVALILAGCAAPVAEAPLIPPKVLFDTCPKPAYPRSALRNEETGTTTLKLLVGADGLVHDAVVQKSSGHPALDNAALVLNHCRFAPATRGGKPVDFWQPMQFVWTLQ
jgi:TonB family protein